MVRLGLLAMVVALLLATVAGGSAALRAVYSGDGAAIAQTSASCQGEDCGQQTWLASQETTLVAHSVLEGGCPKGDLHVVRYRISASEEETMVTFPVCKEKEKE